MSKNKLPDMLTKEQLIKLFENIPIPKCSIACFVALMCGLRINEVCNLQISDINLEARTLKVRDSKNPNRKKQGYGKDRIVPIPEIAISPIKKWFEIIEGGKYFLSSDKSPDLPLRKKTLHIWFAEARKRANLDIPDYTIQYKKRTKFRKETTIYKIRFHHLRHFFAQYVYERTRDLYAVSNLLGHNQVSTTQIYAKVSDKTKRETIDFAFNTPIKTQLFEKNPVNALNYSIPTIAKEKPKEKTPIEILEDRFAKGEISAIDFQTALRLLKARKDYLNENENKTEQNRELSLN
jgi:integrase